MSNKYLKEVCLAILVRLGGFVFPRIVFVGAERFEWFGISLNRLQIAGLRNRICIVGVDSGRLMRAKRSNGSSERGVFRVIREQGQLPPRAFLYAACVDLEITQFDFIRLYECDRGALEKWELQALELRDELARIVSPRLAGVMYVQGYFSDSYIAKSLAVERGVGCCAIENTAYSKKMIVEFASSVAVNFTQAQLIFLRYRDVVKESEVLEWYQRFCDTYTSSKARDHEAGRFVLPKRGVPRVLFIGQCYTDSSLLFDERDLELGDPVDILWGLVEICRELGVELVVKLHPKENGGLNPHMQPYADLTWRKIEMAGKFDAVLADGSLVVDHENRWSTQGMIESSDVCVTINSQAGLECLMADRPVVNLGYAFYSFLKGVRRVSARSEMKCCIEDILVGRAASVDKIELATFLYIYYELYCVEKVADALAKRLRRGFLG